MQKDPFVQEYPYYQCSWNEVIQLPSEPVLIQATSQSTSQNSSPTSTAVSTFQIESATSTAVNFTVFVRTLLSFQIFFFLRHSMINHTFFVTIHISFLFATHKSSYIARSHTLYKYTHIYIMTLPPSYVLSTPPQPRNVDNEEKGGGPSLAATAVFGVSLQECMMKQRDRFPGK